MTNYGHLTMLSKAAIDLIENIQQKLLGTSTDTSGVSHYTTLFAGVQWALNKIAAWRGPQEDE